MDQFQQKAQNNHRKRKPNPDAFVLVPERDVEEIGISTHMGARLETAVLSGFGYHYRKNYRNRSRIKYSNGTVVEVPPGKFVVSINTIAEDLYFRWFMRPPRGSDYVRFYERIKKSTHRLRKSGHLKYYGYVDKSSRGALGSFWSLDGTEFGKSISVCGQSEFRGLYLSKADPAAYTSDGLVNTVDLIGGKLLGDIREKFRYSEMCTSIYKRNMFHDYLNWMQVIASKGADGPRHTSVGTFRKHDLKRIGECPSHIPFFIFDLDGDNPLDTHESTVCLLWGLDALGVDLRIVFVCYTGGSGYHVYVPSALFGSPVFSKSMTAVKIISQLAGDVFGGIDVDVGLFNPTHLVRMVGSKHENSGLYKLAWNADTFLNTSVYDILRSSKQFRPYEIHDPSRLAPVPDLTRLIVNEAERSHTYIAPDFDDVKEFDPDNVMSNTVSRAMEGVSEGEVWNEEKGHVGRSMAMYVVACHFLREYNCDQQKAWQELLKVNQRNDPPLSPSELRGRLTSAIRTFNGNRSRRVYTV